MRHTPWKKSRTYGDNYGGATGHRDSDNIRSRLHSFHAPSEFETLPIFRQDNPSREWFHPLSAENIHSALNALPSDYHGDVTHVWMRRNTTIRNQSNEYVSDAIYGSGVSLITVYPTRTNLIRRHGLQKPSQHCQRIYKKYGVEFNRKGTTWQTKWSIEGLRKFYLLEGLYGSVAFHSAYVWRDGQPNPLKARERREQAWLKGKESLAASVYEHLFGG
jgi:hypothetical protein